MKKENNSANTKRNLDELISKLSAEEILDLNGMRNIRGGDGDGNGSDPILPPPPPPPTTGT